MKFQKRSFERRHIVELVIKIVMQLALFIVAGALGLILWTIISRGWPSLSWEMVSQIPKGGYYMGKDGGILNAIIGSAYLATGGTVLAMLLSVPIALYLKAYLGKSKWGEYVRLSLDVLWGIPSEPQPGGYTHRRPNFLRGLFSLN